MVRTTLHYDVVLDPHTAEDGKEYNYAIVNKETGATEYRSVSLPQSWHTALSYDDYLENAESPPKGGGFMPQLVN